LRKVTKLSILNIDNTGFHITQMASTKPTRAKGAKGPNKPNKNANKTSKPGGRKSSSSSSSKSASDGVSKAPTKKKVDPKTRTAGNAKAKKKRRTYTEKELGVPALNMITPAGVVKPKGKKKGKVFVDDKESMMTILAIVNADKEGQIESKMMKSRQMEEIRQARQKELEARQDAKKNKIVCVNEQQGDRHLLTTMQDSIKDSMRKKRSKNDDGDEEAHAAADASKPMKQKKRVSFGR
jgi:60S ribosomal subunit assembly/export protein LOC1